MQQNDSALVTCEVARNDLSHSANLLCVLSGGASWSASFLFWKSNQSYMHFKWGCKNIYMYKCIVSLSSYKGGSCASAEELQECVISLWCVCWVKVGRDLFHDLSFHWFFWAQHPDPLCSHNQTTMSNHSSLGNWHIQLSIDLWCCN